MIMSNERFFECPRCGKNVDYHHIERYGQHSIAIAETVDGDAEVVGEMSFDCHGIPFRLLCSDCYNEVMGEIGFDGEYYTELDECIEYDY